MKAIDFLKYLRDETFCFPFSQEQKGPGRAFIKPSNAELRRWLQKGSVLVNGKRPGPGDEVEWPIRLLVYFPGSEKSQITVVDDDWVIKNGLG